jgi:uncharacterized protein YvpB
LGCLALILCAAGNPRSLPEKAVIANLAGRAQTYQLSCESRSAVDLAAFWGIAIKEKKFLRLLPRSNNPDLGFVGRPNDLWGDIPPRSYGVHAGPVANLLREFGLDAAARRELTWEDLRQEISAGRPVIVWVIGQMQRGIPQVITFKDGNQSLVARFEHTMILYGYDPNRVYVLDAYTGQKQTYPLKAFKASWKVLGRMAVTVAGPLQPAVAGPLQPAVAGLCNIGNEQNLAQETCPYLSPASETAPVLEPEQSPGTAPAIER